MRDKAERNRVGVVAENSSRSRLSPGWSTQRKSAPPPSPATPKFPRAGKSGAPHAGFGKERAPPASNVRHRAHHGGDRRPGRNGPRVRRDWVEAKDIHKVLEKEGNVLGEEGKSKVNIAFFVCVVGCKRCDPSTLSYRKSCMCRVLSHISESPTL